MFKLYIYIYIELFLYIILSEMFFLVSRKNEINSTLITTEWWDSPSREALNQT